jgi:hypothetical protein
MLLAAAAPILFVFATACCSCDETEATAPQGFEKLSNLCRRSSSHNKEGRRVLCLTSKVPLGGTRCLLCSWRTSFSAAQATCAAFFTILDHKLRYASAPACHASMCAQQCELGQSLASNHRLMRRELFCCCGNDASLAGHHDPASPRSADRVSAHKACLAVFLSRSRPASHAFAPT